MAITTFDEETTKKVIRQVEFYFSDSNLPRDKFLRGTISESEDGMISLALICSFSRMRTHLSLGEGKADDVPENTVKAVAEILRKNSTFIKVSEDGKKIGRTTELAKPEEVIEQVDVRTVAASPFEYAVKLEEVETYFSQFGKVNSVRLPRHVGDKRLFCGTALIEFSTEEDAEKILKQSLVYGGMELELKPKKEFDAERTKEAEVFEKSRPVTASNNKNNKTVEPSYPVGLIVAFKLKNKSSIGSAEENDKHETASDDKDNVKKDVESVHDDMEETEEKASKDADNDKKDCSEKNGDSGVKSEKAEEEVEDGKTDVELTEEKKHAADAYKDNMAVVLREDLKEIFNKYGQVQFIDFSIGEESGYIRFDAPEGAQKARAAAVLSEEGGLIVKNYIATLEPVTGEAEKKYWSLLRGNQDRHHAKFNRGGRGGKFNRGGKFSRGRDNDNGARRSNKHQRV